MTALFTPVRGYLAAKAGATYGSPFIHPSDLEGDDGGEVVRDIRVMYDGYGYEKRILGASVRTTRQMLETIKGGTDVKRIGVHRRLGLNARDSRHCLGNRKSLHEH